MNKIVLWYDNLHKSNCSYADAVYPTRTIVNKLNTNKIEFSIKHLGDPVDHSDTNVYIIELLNVYIDYDIFSLIPEETKELLRQNVKLVLYYPREGHAFDNWLLNIYKNLKKHNLLTNKIFFAYGDNEFVENYLTYIKEHNIEDFLIPILFDFYKGDYYENANYFNRSLSHKRKFDYLFYNGKIRPHRLYAVAELNHRQILDNGLVSLIGSKHTIGHYEIDECLKILTENNCCHSYIKEFANNWSSLVLDTDNNNFSQNAVYNNAINHYSSTFFSVISETGLVYRFITEKIYKPMANLHPFILIGPPNMLSLLRSKGYKTFPEMFNESYDSELDPVKRINLVLDEIEKFANLPAEEKQEKFKSIKDKLEFNKSLYIKTARDTKAKDFIDMFKTIGNTK
jgi:hypothetical protein